MSIAKTVEIIPTIWISNEVRFVIIEFMLVMVLSDGDIQEIWREAFQKHMIL